MQRYYIELTRPYPDGQPGEVIRLDELDTDSKVARLIANDRVREHPEGEIKLFQETHITVEVPLTDDVPPPMPQN